MKIQLLFAFCISAILVSAQDPLCSTLTPGDTTICPIGFNEIFSENAFCTLNNACCSGYFYCCPQQGQPGAKCTQDQLKTLQSQPQGQLHVECFKNASYAYSGTCTGYTPEEENERVTCSTAEVHYKDATVANRNVAKAGTCTKQPQQIPWQCNQPGKYHEASTALPSKKGGPPPPAVCKSCPAGKYRGGYQMETNTEEQCTPCQNAFFQDQDGQTSCKLCPKGQLSQEGSGPNWGEGATGCVTVGSCPSGRFSVDPVPAIYVTRGTHTQALSPSAASFFYPEQQTNNAASNLFDGAFAPQDPQNRGTSAGERGTNKWKNPTYIDPGCNAAFPYKMRFLAISQPGIHPFWCYSKPNGNEAGTAACRCTCSECGSSQTECVSPTPCEGPTMNPYPMVNFAFAKSQLFSEITIHNFGSVSQDQKQLGPFAIDISMQGGEWKLDCYTQNNSTDVSKIEIEWRSSACFDMPAKHVRIRKTSKDGWLPNGNGFGGVISLQEVVFKGVQAQATTKFQLSGGGPFIDPWSAQSIKMCFDCPQGTFRNSSMEECAQCPVGKTTLRPSSECEACPAGNVIVNNVCAQCPLGKFASQSCESCPVGKFRNSFLQMGCLECPAGKFTLTAGNANCQGCAAGEFRNTTSAACEACEAGRYSLAGLAQCIDCPRGKFATLQMQSCQQCPAGKNSLEGQSACHSIICTAGMYLSAGIICRVCPAGKFQNETGQSSCYGENCLPGFFAATNQTSQVPCNICPSGKHAKGISVGGGKWRYECQVKQGHCGQGTHLRAESVFGSCFECESGRFMDETNHTHNDCKSCGPGRYSQSSNPLERRFSMVSEAVACLICPAGKFQEFMVATSAYEAVRTVISSCKDCPANTHSLAGSGVCCGPGKTTKIGEATCFNCPAGKFGINAECVDCPAGKYGDTAGAAECKNCAAGMYKTASGTQLCSGTECEPGTFDDSNVPRTKEISGCKICKPGQFQNQFAAAQCFGNECPAGKFGKPRATASENATCTLCPSGQVQGSTGQEKCEACPLGRLAPLNRVKCGPCIPGQFNGDPQNDNCVLCTPGRYQDKADQTQCKLCPAGKYQNQFSNSKCKFCDSNPYENTYQDQAGQIDCKPYQKCPAGFGVIRESRIHTRQLSCEPCPFLLVAGAISSYNNQDNWDTCTEYTNCGSGNQITVSPSRSTRMRCGNVLSKARCSHGEFLDANDLCSNCPAGKYQNETQHTLPSCKDCPGGLFVAAKECRCPPGQIRTSSGCTDCAAGKYRLVGDTCTDCPTGKYQSLPGMPVCSDCSKNTFQDKTGQANCTQCAAGQFTVVPTAAQCIQCPQGFEPNAVHPQKETLTLYECNFTQQPALGNTPEAQVAMWTESEPPGAFALACDPSNPSIRPAQLRPSGFSANLVSYCRQNAQRSVSCTTGAGAQSGTILNCAKCAAGYYLNSKCRACPAGKYQNLLGQKDCKTCNMHTFQDEAGRTSCKTCVPGQYSNESSPLRHECIGQPCQQHFFGLPMGSPVQLPACQRCPGGEFQNKTGMGVCEGDPCPTGKFQDLIGVQGCKECTKGRYTDTIGSIECKECPSGKYQGSVGEISCIICPPGKYGDPFSASQAECLECPSGKYKTDSGTVSDCEVCPAGKFSAENQPQCTDCEAGKVSRSAGASNCTTCPTGEHAASAGSTQCEACPAGRQAISKACEACAAGKFKAGENGVCEVCPQGHYTASTATVQCTPCERGRFANETGQTQCKRCAAGKKQHQTGQARCDLCPKGRYGNATQQITQIVCEACPTGKFQDNKGKTGCTECQSNKFQDKSGQAECKSCPQGREQPKTGQPSCNIKLGDCPAGQFKNTSVNVCESCKTGQFSVQGQTGSCTKCPAGKHSTANKTHCDPCVAGHFAAEGSGACSACPTGKFSAQGSSSCTQCQAGRYNANTTQSSCVLCPPGRANAKSGSKKFDDCKECAGEQFQPTAGSTKCLKCAAAVQGAPNLFANANGTACEACPAGQFVNLTQCSKCPAGKFTPGTGMTSCTECPFGLKSSAGSSACSMCEGGKQPNAEKTQCEDCAPGKFSQLIAARVPLNTFLNNTQTALILSASARLCLECPPGKHQTGAKQSTCQNCTTGQFSKVSGAFACKQCVNGKFQSLAGQRQCNLCATGTFSATGLLGGTACSAVCPAGKFANATSRTCDNCEAGKFSQNGQTQCTDCEAGKFAQHAGQTRCKICSAGQFNNETGQSKCKGCPAGTSQLAPGSTICTNCPLGKFPLTLAIACTDCAAGKYSAVPASVCKDCPSGKYQGEKGKAYCTQCVTGKISAASLETCVCNQPHQFGALSEVCRNCPTGQRVSTPLQTECLVNTCTCTNGVAATGAECQKHQEHKCVSCNHQYHLDEVTVVGNKTSVREQRCEENKCNCAGIECMEVFGFMGGLGMITKTPIVRGHYVDSTLPLSQFRQDYGFFIFAALEGTRLKIVGQFLKKTDHTFDPFTHYGPEQGARHIDFKNGDVAGLQQQMFANGELSQSIRKNVLLAWNLASIQEGTVRSGLNSVPRANSTSVPGYGVFDTEKGLLLRTEPATIDAMREGRTKCTYEQEEVEEPPDPGCNSAHPYKLAFGSGGPEFCYALQNGNSGIGSVCACKCEGECGESQTKCENPTPCAGANATTHFQGEVISFAGQVTTGPPNGTHIVQYASERTIVRCLTNYRWRSNSGDLTKGPECVLCPNNTQASPFPNHMNEKCKSLACPEGYNQVGSKCEIASGCQFGFKVP